MSDIVTLAGVGRSTISWLINSARDEQLLKLWNVDLHELDLRPGLIDHVALNKRWGRRITFLQNGHVRSSDLGGKSIENMNQFSWIMTIITCCLDVASSNAFLKEIIVALAIRIFENKAETDIKEYLQYEIPEHIQGWRSAACAREMSKKARMKWAALEACQSRLPGYIPSNEAEEVTQFLYWLVATKTASFSTASSDVFSLAILLQEMGFDLIRVGKPNDTFDESIAAVILDDSIIAAQDRQSITKSEQFRKGMRVPLQYMTETVSLWPGSTDNNNRRRKVFADGMAAAGGITMQACSSPWGNRDLGTALHIQSAETKPLTRMETDIFDLGEQYLLINTQQALDALKQLIDSWHIPGRDQRATVIRGLGLVGRRDDDFELHAEIQIFLLGYYYAGLSSILDTSQLSVKEAFGAWGWNDLQFFDAIRSFTKNRLNYAGPGNLHWKHEILKLVAYLFAGSDVDQLSLIKHGVVGVLAKLSVLSAGLVGDADTPEKITRLILLDADSSCIPSSQHGLVVSGIQADCKTESSLNDNAAGMWDAPHEGPDYTSHIEPAWGYDTSHCLIAFRYKGRLVHRISPSEAEAAILEWYPKVSYSSESSKQFDLALLGKINLDLYQAGSSNSLSKFTAEQFLPAMYRATHPEFCGGKIFQGVRAIVPIQGQPFRWERDCITVVATKGLPKARTCILAMYAKDFADSIVTFKEFPWTKYFDGCIPFETRNGGLILLT